MKTQNKRKQRALKKRVVEVKPHTYQPSKVELETDVSVPATPDELRRATMRSVAVKEAKS